MTDLNIKVNVFAGSDIRDAVQDLCLLSARLGVTAIAEMNGVTVMAKPGSDPRDIYTLWKAELDSKRQYKIVCGQAVEIARNEPWDRPTVGKSEGK